MEIVTLTGDGGLGWQYINSNCALTQTSGGVSYYTLNLKPYNWNSTPVHCPYLDCSACLPTSLAASCSPSNLAASQLTLVLLDATSLNVSWSYTGPPASNYTIYAGLVDCFGLCWHHVLTSSLWQALVVFAHQKQFHYQANYRFPGHIAPAVADASQDI